MKRSHIAKHALGLSLCLVAALVAAPAQAAMYFESTTTSEGPQGEQTMRTQAWVDGDNAKITFTESDNPLMVQGAYLLTNDGARTLYLVNPEEKTYMVWDISQMLGAFGGALKSMGPLMKMEFSNPKVEKLADEPGEKILGYDTHHYRFRTTYDSEIRVMGMGQSASNDTTTDTWTTAALTDAGFGAWLRRDPPRTGIAGLDELLDAEIAKEIQGVPLRMHTVTTSRDKKRGRETVTTSEMEVTSIREAAAPAGAFELPAGYEKVEMPTLPF
jgi:hypothetical protein